MTTANTVVSRDRHTFRARCCKSVIFLSVILLAASALARDMKEICDEKCLHHLYEEMFRRAEDKAEAIYKLEHHDLLTDVANNSFFTTRTRQILKEQIKDGYSRFEFPNPSEPIDPGDILPVKPLKFVQIITPDSFGGPAVQDCSSGGPCVFPNNFDVKEEPILLIFQLVTLSMADVDAYIDQQGGKFLRVLLNGVLLTQGQGFGNHDYYAYTTICALPLQGLCMILSFRKDAWYPAAPPWPVWNVRVEFWQAPRIGSDLQKEFECPVYIVPPPTLASYWLHTIGTTVITSRCTTCHAMDTEQKIFARHNGLPVAPTLVPSLLVPGQSVYDCTSCHYAFPYLGSTSSFPENRWATPTVALNINWAQLVNDNPTTWPTVICHRMLSHLPTHALRHQHFHEDARLFWAVAKGELPHPNPGVLPTAPPHNYNHFLERFDKWNDSGALCP